MPIFIGFLVILFFWFMGAGFWGALITVLFLVVFGVFMAGMAG